MFSAWWLVRQSSPGPGRWPVARSSLHLEQVGDILKDLLCSLPASCTTPACCC